VYGKSEDFIDDSCGEIMAARAFTTLVCITSVISTVCLFVYTRKSDNTDQKLLVFGKRLLFVCFIMGIVGVVLGIGVTSAGLMFLIGAAANAGIAAIGTSFCATMASGIIGMQLHYSYTGFL
jgi:hypothetical protein